MCACVVTNDFHFYTFIYLTRLSRELPVQEYIVQE